MKYILFLILFLNYSGVCGQNEFLIEINFGKLSGRVVGNGKPLLFLNGGPGYSSKGYIKTVNELAEKRQVIIFDQRGTGQSKLDTITKKTVNLDEMISDIEVCRKHLGIEKWDVLGNSFGGIYAILYAAKYPDRVDKLVLSATADISRMYKNDLYTFPKVDVSIRLPEELKLLEELQKEDSEYNYLRISNALNARHYVYKEENIIPALYWFLNQSGFNPWVGNLIRRSYRDLKRTKSKIKKYKGEVLLIRGQHDFIQEISMRSLEEKLENSKYIEIKDAGHMIWLDQNKQVRDAVNSFLN